MAVKVQLEKIFYLRICILQDPAMCALCDLKLRPLIIECFLN
jgi:hypothetical protein